MSELTDAITRVLENARNYEPGSAWVGDVFLKTFPPDIVNVDARERELTASDVDAFRAALNELNLVEVNSWVATQGASWLSPGQSAGVSFQVRPLNEGELSE